MDCCKKVPKEDHEIVRGKGSAEVIKVRVILQMDFSARNWPGDFALMMLARNESQGKTLPDPAKTGRAHMNDYQPGDQLAVYLLNEDFKGIEEGYAEKIEIPEDTVKTALTPELMNSDGSKKDVMVVCRVKAQFASDEWLREITATAQLIDKGSDLYLPA